MKIYKPIAYDMCTWVDDPAAW